MIRNSKEVPFDSLLGLVLTNIERKDDELIFTADLEGRRFILFHSQDCCETVNKTVNIEDIVGDLSDLLFSPILRAEEATNRDDPPRSADYAPDSYTWTYYKLATIKGYVDIRWYGESNGYYSENVSFEEYMQ